MGETEQRDRLPEDRQRYAIGLVAAVLLSLGVGFAAGSVLAGEPLVEQVWLIAVLFGAGSALLALYAQSDSDE